MPTKFRIVQDDITKLKVDVVVNAANSMLHDGAGVCGAIFKAAGHLLDRECELLIDAYGEVDTGCARLSYGYSLSADYIIHAVGPIVSKQGLTFMDKILLSTTYINCLKIAENLQAKSIAFPCISTGIYNFPQKEAAQIAIKTCREWAEENEYPKEIIFCCFTKKDFDIYNEILEGDNK